MDNSAIKDPNFKAIYNQILTMITNGSLFPPESLTKTKITLTIHFLRNLMAIIEKTPKLTSEEKCRIAVRVCREIVNDVNINNDIKEILSTLMEMNEDQLVDMINELVNLSKDINFANIKKCSKGLFSCCLPNKDN